MSSTTRYSTALFNIMLAGSSAWALRVIDPDDLKCALFAFGIILIHSMVAVVRFGHPDFGGSFRAVHDTTSNMMTAFTVPLIVTQLYLQEQYLYEFCYIHLLAASIPALSYYMEKTKDSKLRDFVIAANIFSLLFISFSSNNHWGTALGVSCALNHFGLNLFKDMWEVPCTDLYTIGYCFFNYFAVRTLLDN